MAELPTQVPTDERRAGWGMATEAVCRVLRPRSVEDVLAAYALARSEGSTVAFWGAGRSYGDAALNEARLLLDFREMDRVVSWDPGTGLITVEPGVTLQRLWQSCLPDGWWPPVVSGTMHTTVGGLVAANAHGKNNLMHGPIGDHVQALTLVSPDGQVRELTREGDPDLFNAVIGGFGWLGALTSITLRMKQVWSGRVEVEPRVAGDLDEMFDLFEKMAAREQDYVVGWVDAFASGERLGRGQVHAARYLDAGEDPEGRPLLSPADQELPARFFGLIPKRWLWRFMRPFANRLGMRLINAARYSWMRRESHQEPYRQPHAQFNFLLDFVPDWKRVYEPGGLVQVQLFVPRERAPGIFRKALERCQQARLEPWLVVMKRHRPDRYLLSHGLDGYSLAMDFPVQVGRRGELETLGRALDDMAVDSGGRLYFAKDALATPDQVRRSLGPDRLERFFALKRQVDPDELLQGNLYRRLMRPLAQQGVWSDDRPRPEGAPEPLVPEVVGDDEAEAPPGGDR